MRRLPSAARWALLVLGIMCGVLPGSQSASAESAADLAPVDVVAVSGLIDHVVVDEIETALERSTKITRVENLLCSANGSTSSHGWKPVAEKGGGIVLCRDGTRPSRHQDPVDTALRAHSVALPDYSGDEKGNHWAG